MTVRIILILASCSVLALGSVLSDNFNDTAHTRRIWNTVTLREGRSGNAAFSHNTSTNDRSLSDAVLPVSTVAGKTLRVAGWVKARDVSRPLMQHNGIKLMIRYETPKEKRYPQATIPVGTFDWRMASFIVRIPDIATNVVLSIGLEYALGDVWFDDVDVSVTNDISEIPLFPERPQTIPSSAMRPWGVYRGMNINRELTQEDIRAFAATGGNLLRVDFAFKPLIKKTPPYDLDESVFGVLERTIAYCRESKIKALIDPHTYPGTRENTTMRADDEFWKDFSWHEHLIRLWREIARRYRDNAAVAGYDLMNEPHLPNGGAEGTAADYNLLVKKLITAIREIDTNHAIIIATPVISFPSGHTVTRLKGIEYLNPPIDRNLVYKPHMYEPTTFTHQGLRNKEAALVPYPGFIHGYEWDANAIARELAPVAAYAKRYGVPILIGEFSVVRWANTYGTSYLRDVITFFEKEGWSWCYHAWRAADVWNPEMSITDRNDMTVYPSTPRLDLLKSYFSRNK